MKQDSRIYVAGHTGLVGSAILRELKEQGYNNFVLRTHGQLDLTDQNHVKDFFIEEMPEYIFFAAGKVGGIQANNQYMADFAMENMKMTCNVIDGAHHFKTKKLLYIASSCIYPRESQQPLKTEYILNGPLESTNEGYALAKITGIRMCTYYKRQYGDDFISCIPANVYGPYDCFDENRAHVIPALMKRFHEAKINDLSQVEIWGSGQARREFLYIADAAKACVLLMKQYAGEGTINAGLGKDHSIKELAEMIAKTVGYTGKLVFDHTRPDGMPRRMLDSDKINQLGWHAETDLEQGLALTYTWFLKNIEMESRKND